MFVFSRWLILTNNCSLSKFDDNFRISYLGNVLNDSVFLKNLNFLKSTFSYKLLTNYLVNNLRRPKLVSLFFFGFLWYRFVLFSGLGYKRRLYKKHKVMFAYSGDRHWVLYFLNSFGSIVPVKRRTFIFFSSKKGNLNENYSFFSFIRRPQVYKMKGFLDARVLIRFLFVRRIKIRGVRTKLSKKQRFL